MQHDYLLLLRKRLVLKKYNCVSENRVGSRRRRRRGGGREEGRKEEERGPDGNG